jgi:hypothetical protein
VEPANEGEEMLAFALNDRQTGTLKITPSLVDLDGKTFKKDDGSPIAVEDVAISWASSDDAVASVEATDGGRTLTVKSGDTGSVILSGRMDYPGGVSKQVQYGVAVGNSDAADPEVTFDVADETPPTP